MSTRLSNAQLCSDFILYFLNRCIKSVAYFSVRPYIALILYSFLPTIHMCIMLKVRGINRPHFDITIFPCNPTILCIEDALSCYLRHSALEHILSFGGNVLVWIV